MVKSSSISSLIFIKLSVVLDIYPAAPALMNCSEIESPCPLNASFECPVSPIIGTIPLKSLNISRTLIPFNFGNVKSNKTDHILS